MMFQHQSWAAPAGGSRAKTRGYERQRTEQIDQESYFAVHDAMLRKRLATALFKGEPSCPAMRLTARHAISNGSISLKIGKSAGGAQSSQ
jgi:hypothetical protein